MIIRLSAAVAAGVVLLSGAAHADPVKGAPELTHNALYKAAKLPKVSCGAAKGTTAASTRTYITKLVGCLNKAWKLSHQGLPAGQGGVQGQGRPPVLLQRHGPARVLLRGLRHRHQGAAGRRLDQGEEGRQDPLLAHPDVERRRPRPDRHRPGLVGAAERRLGEGDERAEPPVRPAVRLPPGRVGEEPGPHRQGLA
ncbi:hypothetical protein ACFSTC_28645 [Nonomuraea ferruginea]